MIAAQNDCSSAITITNNNTYTVAAITSPVETPCYSNIAEDGDAIKTYWYKFTPTTSGIVNVNSSLPANESPNSENTRLSILRGSCGSLECYDSANDVNATSQNFLTNLTFPVQAGVTYYIVWDSFYEDNTFDFTFNFTAQNCTRVYYVNSPSSISTTEVTLNWEPSVTEPSSYTVEYGLQGFTIGSGVTSFSEQAQTTLTSLQTGGTYDYYIRTNCSSNQNSEWSGPYRFTLTKTLPYNSGFDTTQELGGWIQVNASPNFNLVTNAANALSVPSYYLMNALIGQTNNYWLISPGVSFDSGTNYLVTFNLRTSSLSANRSLTLTLGTSPDPATHTQIIAAESGFNSNPNYSPFTYSFTAPENGVFYIGLRDTSVGVINNSLRIDNFQLSANLNTDTLTSSNVMSYPNPVSELLFIKNTSQRKIEKIEILDIEGKLIRILEGDFENQRGHNISDLSSGIYLLKVTAGSTKLIKKIVKK